MKTTTLKRKLALFTAVIMALTLWTAVPFQASAGDPDVYTDGTLAYTLDEEHNATITGYANDYTGDKTTLNIPASIADNQNEDTYYDVTAIGDSAFKETATLISIVIPDSVEIIGEAAFFECEIQILVIGNSVKSIGDTAFEGNELTSIVIPASVENIDSGAFQNCSALTKVEILNNSGEMTIGEGAFSYCEAITDVTVSQAVLDVEGGISALFPASAGSITTVTIADGVTEIPEGAFEGLDSLETIVLPDSITTIADGAFDNLESLTEITIPDSVTIGEDVLPDDLGDLQIWCYNGSTAHTAAGANAVVMIESIKLNKTAVSLNLNGTQPLTASVATPVSVTVGTPEEMPEEITWSSSNEDVATVDEAGNVTAAGYGSAKITATIIPHSGATLTATCTVTVAPPPQPTYAVTVGNGTGSGSFVAGASVSITANAPAEGKVFDTWISSDGVTFADATSASTTFTMPAKAVTVTANYKDDPNASGGDDPNPPTTDNGWVYEDGVWKFYADGEVATGWIHDGTAWYYLDSDGEMQTGWVYDTDYKAWFYFAGNGAMKTGWVKDNGNWYYLSGNGAMVAGKWFKDTDGSWYYLSGNGKMLVGKQNIGGKTYTFKSNGVWVS